MKTIGYILYFSIGVIQFFAILTGFSEAFGFFGILLAFLLAELPIIGTGFAIYGAVSVWGWTIWQAILMFIVPIGLALLMAMLPEKY
jgi:hypothetical protein